MQSPDESFQLADADTVASVTTAHRAACATARAAVADLPLDAVVTGHRAGPRTLHWRPRSGTSSPAKPARGWKRCS